MKYYIFVLYLFSVVSTCAMEETVDHTKATSSSTSASFDIKITKNNNKNVRNDDSRNQERADVYTHYNWQAGYNRVPLVFTQRHGHDKELDINASWNLIYKPYTWYLFPLQVLARSVWWGIEKMKGKKSVVTLEDKLYLCARMEQSQVEIVRELKKRYMHQYREREEMTFFKLVKTLARAQCADETNNDHAIQLLQKTKKQLCQLRSTALQELADQGKAYTCLAFLSIRDDLIIGINRSANEKIQEQINKSVDPEKSVIENSKYAAASTIEQCNILAQAQAQIQAISEGVPAEKSIYAECAQLLKGQYNEDMHQQVERELRKIIWKKIEEDDNSTINIAAIQAIFQNLFHASYNAGRSILKSTSQENRQEDDSDEKEEGK